MDTKLSICWPEGHQEFSWTIPTKLSIDQLDILIVSHFGYRGVGRHISGNTLVVRCESLQQFDRSKLLKLVEEAEQRLLQDA